MYSPKLVDAVTLNNVNFIPIEFGNISPSSIILQARTGIDVLITDNPSTTEGYLTIKAGSHIELDVAGLCLGPLRSATMVTNGAFTGGATGWTYNDGYWSYTSNRMDKDGDGTGALSQATVIPTAAKIYEIVYTLSDPGGGMVENVVASLGGVNGATRSTLATHKEYIKASDATALAFTPSNASRFRIDTIAVYLLTNALFAKASSGSPQLEILYL